VRLQAAKCHVRLVLSAGHHINADGERVQGMFTPPIHSGNGKYWSIGGSIKVAIGGRRSGEWLYSLAHEYAHFLQWRNDDPIYETEDYLKLEIHTEQQALELCKEFKLPMPRKQLLIERKKYISRLKRSPDRTR